MLLIYIILTAVFAIISLELFDVTIRRDINGQDSYRYELGGKFFGILCLIFLFGSIMEALK